MNSFKLNMLGIGSAFNAVEYGNTSGYFEDDDNLYIIDCGSTVFNQILKTIKHKLNKNIHIIITHTHTDHIGSLGTFIEYCYFTLSKKLNIVCASKIKNSLISLLEHSGIPNDMYNVTYSHNTNTVSINSDIKVFFIQTTHVDTLSSFSLIIRNLKTNQQLMYSGDINNYDELNLLLQIASSKYKSMDSIYLDMSSKINNPVHEYDFNKLKHIQTLFKSTDIYLMHLDDTISVYQNLLKKYHIEYINICNINNN